MNTILNQLAFQEAINTYAISMGIKKADGSPKPISNITEKSLEIAIIKYLISDNRMKDII